MKLPASFMRSVLFYLLVLIAVLAVNGSIPAQSKVSQSKVVAFPRHRKVKIKTIEEVGKFPKIEFYDLATKSRLLETLVKDDNGFLIPRSDGHDSAEPILRFAILHKKGFRGPLIMAVGMSPGGSDNGFFLQLFGEVNGKLVRLLDTLPRVAIQGGFYVGYLNKRFGFGLVTWNFIWGNDMEGHEGRHFYDLSVFKIKSNRFMKIHSFKTRRKYNFDHAQLPPRELGIRAIDQRRLIPGLKRYLY